MVQCGLGERSGAVEGGMKKQQCIGTRRPVATGAVPDNEKGRRPKPPPSKLPSARIRVVEKP